MKIKYIIVGYPDKDKVATYYKAYKKKANAVKKITNLMDKREFELIMLREIKVEEGSSVSGILAVSVPIQWFMQNKASQ